MTAVYSFYDKETGVFRPVRITTSSKNIERNTPAGCLSIEGRYDSLSQRVDIKTGQIVDYIPPQPSEDHEWIERRWRLKTEIVEQQQQSTTARAELLALEAKQHRRVRELLAEEDPQLKAIDDQIAKLRKDL